MCRSPAGHLGAVASPAVPDPRPVPQPAHAPPVEANTHAALADDAAGLTASIYMLRTTHQHHVHLSAMADLKANILITASSILLSVIIALSADSRFEASLAVLAGGTVAGLFFAVIAVVPKFRRGTGGEFNPLFFGSFAHLDVDDYLARMTRLAGDPAAILAAQVRDLHQLGCYLETRKYRWLRVAYGCFLAGLIGGGITEIVVRSV